MDALRAQLISSGEHIYAVCKLGENYSAEEYLQAVSQAREVDAGPRYADRCIGVDVDELLRGVEETEPDDVVKAVEANLRRRGIAPDEATYAEYADALSEAGS